MYRTMRTVAWVLTVAASVAAGCESDGGHGGSGSPAAPTELMVGEMDGGAHLTWKDNSDNEATFMIERKAGTGSFQTLATVPFDTVQYHDANLTAGTTYVYRVMAMGKVTGKDSAYSNEVTFMLPSGGAGDGGADDGGAGGGPHGDAAAHDAAH